MLTSSNLSEKFKIKDFHLNKSKNNRKFYWLIKTHSLFNNHSENVRIILQAKISTQKIYPCIGRLLFDSSRGLSKHFDDVTKWQFQRLKVDFFSVTGQIWSLRVFLFSEIAFNGLSVELPFVSWITNFSDKFAVSCTCSFFIMHCGVDLLALVNVTTGSGSFFTEPLKVYRKMTKEEILKWYFLWKHTNEHA